MKLGAIHTALKRQIFHYQLNYKDRRLDDDNPLEGKMKIIAFPLVTCVLISGCANLATPDSSDRTPPSLSLVIYHSSPVIDSPNTGRYTASGVNRAERCVYVKSPFRVTASAADDGGIREISIGTSRGPKARESEGDIFATTTPDQPIQFAREDHKIFTFSNPGKSPVSGNVIVHYENSRTYKNASLSAVYEFPAGVTEGIFRADAYNFRVDPGNDRSASLTQIYNYQVRLAGPNNTPGSSCAPGRQE
jgi:hypothetical protein